MKITFSKLTLLLTTLWPRARALFILITEAHTRRGYRRGWDGGGHPHIRNSFSDQENSIYYVHVSYFCRAQRQKEVWRNDPLADLALCLTSVKNNEITMRM